MKILHIIVGLNDGGAEAVLFRLCKTDKDATHIVVSLMDEGKYAMPLEEQGVEVHCLNMNRGRLTFSALLKLRHLIRATQPDIVQTWMYHADIVGGVISWLCGYRKIYWNIRHSNLDRITTKKTTLLAAKVCALLSWVIPKGIICCSEKGAKIHKALGYKDEKIRVVPNGYNTSEFFPDSMSGSNLRRELVISPDIPLIGMVARFDVQKDHQNLFQALSHLAAKDIKFNCLLVGTAMEAGNSLLMKTIKAFEIEEYVTLLGRCNDIPQVMNTIDLHVLSSSGEAFPNVLAEAMACGTPCVTTDVGDAALIVGETGWVVPAKDSEKLVKAILEAFSCMADDSQWQLRRDAARRRIVENFSIEKMVQSYRAFWGV